MNMLEGEGFYQWSDGRSYNGTWSYDNMNGFGEFRWPDGRRYIGKFMNDKIYDQDDNAKSRMEFPDGRYWVGQFRGGLLDG